MPVGDPGDEQAEADVFGRARECRERRHSLEAVARPGAVHRLEVVEAPDAGESEVVREARPRHDLVPVHPLLRDVEPVVHGLDATHGHPSTPRRPRGMAATPSGHVSPSWATRPLGRIINHMKANGTISVLVVDDSAAYREAARAVVDLTEGFTCVADAENGEDALAKARALHPALVLMDVNMPGIGGCEAARQLRAELPRTVVMLMSTYDSIGAPGTAESCGASYYLRKEELRPELLRALWTRF